MITKLVSIIIPTYNEENFIEKCVQSILVNEVDFDYEIIIVDGMSIDNTRKIVKRLVKENNKIKLLFNSERHTPVGLNIGIQQAKGKYILLLGAHAYVANSFLQKSLETIKAYDAECVGGRVEIVSNTKIGKDIAYALKSPFGVGNAKFRYAKNLEYVDTVAYGLYKREVFTQLGLFDEMMIRGQDYEFNHRMILAGMKILYNPEIKSYWYSRPTLKSLMKQQFYNGFWKILAQFKRKNIASFRHIVPPLFTFYIILALIASFFYIQVLLVNVVLLIIYITVALIYSKDAIQDNARLWLLPVIYFIIHFSYGFGYIMGLFRFGLRYLIYREY
ncbi:MAG: glycosyltransferase family 2 protein [Bacillota bacterium]|nr:glycosyltransferase family 2 protein [Bacillota bacterium]